MTANLDDPEPNAGMAKGYVRVLLRLEGLAVLAISVALYAKNEHNWGFFALFFFAPDLSILGYLMGARFGAFLYNCAHSYIGPIVLFAAGLIFGYMGVIASGLIWSAHIGFDRFFAFGLKYADEFGKTHLGRIQRRRVNGPIN